METEPDLDRELDALEKLDGPEQRERGQRLHPLSPLFEVLRSFASFVVPGLIVLLLAAGDRYEIWYMALFVPAVVSSLLRYVTRRYALTERHIVVREGIFFRKTRNIPYARVQNIDTVQNPLHRLFGVVEVRLETAGGSEPEAVFRVLSIAKLDEIRDGVFGRRARPAPAPDAGAETRVVQGAFVEDVPALPAGAREVFRMGPLDVAYFGLLSQKGIALLFGLLFVIWEFELWERLVSRLPFDVERLPQQLGIVRWLAVGFGIFLLLQALTVCWAFLTLFGFRIVRVGEDLRTTCGAWTRQTATLPRHRIQFVQVQEGLLQRPFGRMALKVLTAGGDSTEDTQISRKWLVPLARRDLLEEILAEVQPETSFAPRSWTPVHPRAWRRLYFRTLFLVAVPTVLVARDAGWWASPVALAGLVLGLLWARRRARRLGFDLGPSAVYLRDGVLSHLGKAVRFSKIQSVSLRRTPFDRWHGMASVHVDTAGAQSADLSFAIPFLRLRDAAWLAKRLRREAARTAFTW